MSPPGAEPRLVWILAGPKAGDNAQLRTLAAALHARCGWPIEEKSLAFQSHELLLHLLSRPTLAGLDRPSRSAIAPPWPDLVLTAGRRNELVARWIRDRSNSQTRIVHMGRPWSRPERFDLVVSTPQYALAASRNVLVNQLPLHDPNPAEQSAVAERWRSRLEQLPAPRVALLVGGNSGPFVFTPALAKRMASQINAFVRSLGGSLMITTSPRTPVVFSERLWAHIDVPMFGYQWTPGGDNPYQGLLALADHIVVTAESVSMISEALATGKPTYLASVSQPGACPWWLRSSSYRWKSLSHRLAMTIAPMRFSRDVGRIHAQLVSAGRAAWLGDGPPDGGAAEGGDLRTTVERVVTLMNSDPT